MKKQKYFIHIAELSVLFFSDVILLIFTIVMRIFLPESITLGELMLPVITIALIVVVFCLLNYREMFKQICFHEDGIDFYLLNRKINSYLWEDICKIDLYCLAGGANFRIVVKSLEENILINATKNIQRAIKLYAPETVYINNQNRN